MKKEIKKNNRGSVQHHFYKSGAGFVILFAVTLSALLLSIALGISNITLREIKFGTSARDTNDAFFAADTGIECAFYYDRAYPNKAFLNPTDVSTMTCAGISFTTPTPSPPNFCSFIVSGLGSGGQACTKVTVDKTLSLHPTKFIITSSGYNNGGSTCTPLSNTVERQIESRF